jgi:hypothetical protein
MSGIENEEIKDHCFDQTLLPSNHKLSDTDADLDREDKDSVNEDSDSEDYMTDFLKLSTSIREDLLMCERVCIVEKKLDVLLKKPAIDMNEFQTKVLAAKTTEKCISAFSTMAEQANLRMQDIQSHLVNIDANLKRSSAIVKDLIKRSEMTENKIQWLTDLIGNRFG